MYKIIIYSVIGLGLIFGYVKYIEFNGVFFPAKGITLSPGVMNLAFEDIYIHTEDNIKINGWFIPHDQAKYTLLFLHGNAGNIADRLEKISLLRKAGLNIFIFDYRGYGLSEGGPSERGIYVDAKSAYEYLLNSRKIQPEQIILYGESLGTAVAVNLASGSYVRAIILEGAFTSGKDMARKYYPFLPAAIFSIKLDSLEKVKKISGAKLFIHSKDDEIVPIVLARKLYDAAGKPKEFVEITGGHNSAYLDSEERYISSISSFIERL